MLVERILVVLEKWILGAERRCLVENGNKTRLVWNLQRLRKKHTVWHYVDAIVEELPVGLQQRVEI